MSERFGLWISFYPFTQDEYLAIVAEWLTQLGLSADAIDAARPGGSLWAIERGSRSGRGLPVARVTMRGAAMSERKSYHVMEPTDRTPVEVAVGC